MGIRDRHHGALSENLGRIRLLCRKFSDKRQDEYNPPGILDVYKRQVPDPVAQALEMIEKELEKLRENNDTIQEEDS